MLERLFTSYVWILAQLITQISDQGGPDPTTLGWDWWTAVAAAVGPGPLGFLLWATQIKNPPIWVSWREHNKLEALSEKQQQVIDKIQEDNKATLNKVIEWALSGMKGPAPM